MTGKLDNLFSFIRNIGTLYLENGGETSMIEESIERVLIACDCTFPNVYVTPTGIFYSFTINNRTHNDIIRIKSRGINLTIIDEVNNFVRGVCLKQLDLVTANKKCDELKLRKYTGGIRKMFFSALSGMFFTLLFDGGIMDGLVAFLAGFMVQYLVFKKLSSSIGMFFAAFIGTTITAFTALLFAHFFSFINFDKVVTGAIMPLLPGLALTNSLKDTLTGNLVSGMSRLGEVILVAFAIASGIGIVMYFYIHFGGAL
jgi:uncharacterized membrane protein YjjP (DUF1212 family)